MDAENQTSDRIESGFETWLLLIVILGAFLRIAFLATAPVSFSVDEASDGYDAYSILLTLRDRYGVYLPFFTKALGDYIEPLYIFLIIPLIKVFGLNEFSTRLGSAIVGTSNVVVIYYLTKELFKNRKIALLATLLFAISPWHIFFSRLAFRAILVPFFFCLALLLFLKSFQKPNYLPASALTFAISLYTYNSPRVFVPLFLLGLTILNWRHLWKYRKQAAIATLLFMAIFIPLFLFWITPQGMARPSRTGIETNFVQIVNNYLSYFDPGFLFFNGDPNPRRSVLGVGVGELYVFELFTVLPGLYFLWKTKSPVRSILLLWLLLYPLPAALIGPSHAIRSLVGAPLFSILSGYGLYHLSYLVKTKHKRYFRWVVLGILTASLGAFLKFYFIYSQYTIANTSQNWQYGLRDAISFAEKSLYECTIVSDRFWRPNIYILFYTKYPPDEHQRSPIEPSVRTGYSLGKYHVLPISASEEIQDSCLYLIKPEEAPLLMSKNPALRELKSIKTPQGIEKIKLLGVR